MRIPNAERAYVPREKLLEYLLDEAHPSGGPKAKLFRAFGYVEANWEVLAEELRAIAAGRDVVSHDSHEYGVNYVVDGVLQTPIGKQLRVRTVWIVRRDAAAATFVTAYPI